MYWKLYLIDHSHFGGKMSLTHTPFPPMYSILMVLFLLIGERLVFVQCLPRRILVLGGNGFMGAATVERLIQKNDNVTIVNRGNWYWDSKERIFPHVQHIECDRKADDIKKACPKLIELVNSVESFDGVIDFSAYGAHEVQQSAQILKDKTSLYVLISSDSIYDVCEKKHRGYSKETDSVRPESEDEKETLKRHHDYSNRKLEAEEEILKQRIEGGFPFVILRLPDVVGPRDTTYRWWIYQLWLKLAPKLTKQPVRIPQFLTNYPISLVYSEDVARTVVGFLTMGPQIKDQAINLAYADTLDLETLLTDMRNELGLEGPSFEFTGAEDKNPLYLYPSVRQGPMDVAKAQSLLDWQPTPWSEVVTKIVQFYEDAFIDEKFAQQRDEIIQIVGHHLYQDNMDEYYEELEKLYRTELNHFKQTRDEL